jgi:hypothetical protein
MDDANWTKYVATLDDMDCNDIPNPDPDVYCQNMTDNILKAAEAAIPKTKGNIPRRDPVPWWNEECEKAVKSKAKALFKFRKNRTQPNRVQYRLSVQHTKDTILMAKNNTWN